MGNLGLNLVGSVSRSEPPKLLVHGTPGQHTVVQVSTDSEFLDSNAEARGEDNFFSSRMDTGDIVLDEDGESTVRIPPAKWTNLISGGSSTLSARALPVEEVDTGASPVIRINVRNGSRVASVPITVPIGADFQSAIDKANADAGARALQPNWKPLHTAGAFVIVAVIVLVGIVGVRLTGLLWTWLIVLVLLGTFTVLAGDGITGVWRGALIDETNKMSISRLQLFLWTVVVLSAFLAAALANIATGQANPLAISIPQPIWVVLGISTTSLIGTPLIQSQKMTQSPDVAQSELTRAQRGPGRHTNLKAIPLGLILVNAGPEDAQWSDLFEGDETGNGAHLDLGKIQLFYFTLILVLAYAVAIGAMFLGGPPPIKALPGLDQSAVALLGISHAGYLSNQLIPHSKTSR